MTNPNDPAFQQMVPQRDPEKDYWYYSVKEGLTKREYFAAMAMSALVIHREVHLDHEAKLPADVIARMAIAQADALIA